MKDGVTVEGNQSSAAELSNSKKKKKLLLFDKTKRAQ